MRDESLESSKKARLAMMELAHMMSVPMSLTAVVRLGVPDAIWAGGANTPVSAAEILKRVRPSGGGDSENLQRVLRMLTSYNIFNEHVSGDGSRKYSLADVGKTLATDDEGLTHGYYVLQHHQDALMKVWPMVHDAVVEPETQPFVKVHGEPAYIHYGKNLDMNILFQKAMSGTSVPFMRTVLNGYDGFKDIHRLVDVGGSGGDCLRMILQKFPNIREAINFDLPDVVAEAPPIPGVIHVGGDMLKSVPSGDAIFMKWMLLTFTDEECKLTLQNCYKALPPKGKLIACEPVLPEETDDSVRTRALLEGDIYIMTMYRTKGKHRTEKEFKQLGLSAGFPHFRAFYFDYYHTVLEFQK